MLDVESMSSMSDAMMLVLEVGFAPSFKMVCRQSTATYYRECSKTEIPKNKRFDLEKN
jgi:hypothetical protein